jgi:3-dehydroquinate synthase
LGHTIGHAIEAVAGYGEILHGEAISIGMIGAAKLAVDLGYPEHIYSVTKNVIRKAGLPIKLPSHYDTDSIMVAMMRDKKFKEGNMVFIVPIDIGRVEINKAVSADRVRAIVEQLKEEA